jgi:hypothetical protein
MSYAPDTQQLPSLPPRPNINYEIKVDSGDSTPPQIDYYIEAFVEDISFNRHHYISLDADPLELEFKDLARSGGKKRGSILRFPKRLCIPRTKE